MNNYIKEIFTSNDGSTSIFLPELGEQYHSIHGAVQESMLVYIKHGLCAIKKAHINILEIGFGTGLNCLLTLEHQQNHQRPEKINYFALEPFPITEKSLIAGLNYTSTGVYAHLADAFERMHQLIPSQGEFIRPEFYVEIIPKTLQTFESAGQHFDLVYFDAFGPRVQPELWMQSIFDKVLNMMVEGGVLTTYCAKGEVKRNMRNAGFTVESLPGPPGKREMIRALKH